MGGTSSPFGRQFASMPLGTLDRTPPPFFRQGPSALSKLVFFSALAIFLMVADSRFKFVEPLRQALAIVLLPAQRVLAVPVEIVQGGAGYVRGLREAQAAEAAARTQLASAALQSARAEQLAAENARLRALLELKPAITVRTTAAKVLYDAADPYSRKVFIDRGLQHGVARGAPVINEAGVLGQVTQAYALTSEVTLLSDRDAAIPVLNTRTQQRSAAFGAGRAGGMELRFMSGNADVQVGDLLNTSGLDGIYPPGLRVATVAAVERRVESGFARIALTPAANPDGVRQVLVLEPLVAQLPPRPEPAAAEPAPKGERQLKIPPRRAAGSAPP
jgi:rod shape-determining protein MreC